MDYMKKTVVVLLIICMLIPCVCGCVVTDDTSPSETGLTLAELESWCEEAGNEFFEGFLNRDYNKMATVSSVAFREEYEDFFEKQDKKVWLSTFYDNYLAGSQAISGTFISSANGVISLEYSIVCADYTSGNRNWLLMYKTTLTFDVNLNDRNAMVNNPEVIFELYNNMCNDYTSHVAAMALGINSEGFDLSEYYYDEDLGVYIPYEIEVDETTQNMLETQETTEESENESEVIENDEI